MNYNNELKTKVLNIEIIIKKFLPKETGYHKTVAEAMNYSILAGGKRLRPMIMQETYKLFGGNKEIVEPFMAAIEMIHTYSLVHDDLPCMDNDEYRRGRKTTHIVYGEGTAVLAGDALLNCAYETAMLAFQKTNDVEEIQRVSKALKILTDKAGLSGMIGGQIADIEAEDMGEQVTEEHVLFIYEHKTAALIQSAMMIGAILAGASEENMMKIDKCAYNLGVAFQIQDDILDITSSLEVLGKQVGSDIKNKKKTYVTIKGIDGAKEEVGRLFKEAIAIIESLDMRNEFLEMLMKQLITREK